MGWRRVAVSTVGHWLARCSESGTDWTRPGRANGLESSPGECWSDWRFADRLEGGPSLARVDTVVPIVRIDPVTITLLHARAEIDMKKKTVGATAP